MNNIAPDREITLPATLTPEVVNQQLPRSLLDTLERRWYEDFDIYDYSLLPVSSSMLDEESRFLRVFEVAHGANLSQSLHLYNMQNVISSLRDGSHALAYAVCSNGQHVKLLMGVRRHRARAPNFPTYEYVDVLYRALRSNYPGIVLSREPDQPYHVVPYSEYKADIIDLMQRGRYLAGITGIPSLRNPNHPGDSFSQSVDRLVDALRGEVYTLLILAEPILEDRLTQVLAQLRSIGGEVHALVRQSKSVSGAMIQSRSETEGMSQQATLGVGQLVSAIFGISFGMSTSHQETFGTSRSMGAAMTQETLDKTAQFCEQVLDHYVKRVQAGRSLGFWNVGIFLASDNLNSFLRAQGIARSLFSGQHSYFEPIRALNFKDSVDVRKSLANLRIPILAHLRGAGGKAPQPIDHPLGRDYQSLGTPMTTDELSILISFPNREVPGLKLKPVADFNLNPPPVEGAEIGNLLYRGEPLNTRITISPKSLTRHTFVTGLTGSGKTNTCLALLADAYKNQHMNFLVIDPAKTEYRFLLYAPELGKDLLVFTLGDEQTAPFRLNPFEFARGFPLLTHVDLIKAVFNAAFPMYASMPYLLEEALLAIYRERGWDIGTSTNRFVDVSDPEADYTPYLPRLSDLYTEVDAVVASKRYGAQLTQDISAALKARLGSLLHGGKGLMLDTQRSTSLTELLNRPVVLELRRIGDEDEKAFIMALLFIMLYEACQTRPPHGQLSHVTVIEEAHRLLRNVPTVTSVEMANPRGKALETFTDMMAEMRAYGEGFVIVDQMPGKLVPDVIKGSNLKIVHRLLAQDDRYAVGNAMGLTPSQVEHLPRLTIGQAIVHSEELREACLVQIDPVEDELVGQQPGDTPSERERATCERLVECAEEFNAHHRDVFRRYPACAICDAPCKYLSSWNEPNDRANVSFARMFAALLYSDEPDYRQLWQDTETILRRQLAAQYNAAQWSEGIFLCHLVQLSRATVTTWCDYYNRTPARLGVGVQLQRQVANILQALLTETSAEVVRENISDLRGVVCNKLALQPSKTRLGCTICQRQCHFGCLVQQQAPLQPDYLTARIREESFQRDYRRLVKLMKEIACQTLDIPIPDEELFHLGYCYLANSTDKRRVLESYQGTAQE